MSLSGRIALVTGAGRGIGKTIAGVLCENGMAVAINDIDPGPAERTAEELRAKGYRALAVPGDASVPASVTAMFDRVEQELGPLWLLVNNAGVYHSAPVESFPESEWDREFAVDCKAVFLCSQAAVRRMIPRGGGRIVVVSSIAGQIVRTQQIAYCAAKAAAIHFSRCLAVEVAGRGITVNCICPGMTDSDMLRQSAEQRGVSLDRYQSMIPAGRLAQPRDHADAVAWLASEDASHVTGQVIAIDGAQSLYHPLTS
jgi:NAD(P)-dependent dehydrogenase (short-subunit alcohol dehydrogenase family)